MLLSVFLREVYAPLCGVCPRTIQLYDYTLRSWGETLGRPPEMTDLEELSVARFLAERLRTKSVATAAKDRAQIRALWGFAARCGETALWPQIRRIRVPERVPQCWLTSEMQSLLVAAGERQGSIAGVPASGWWRAVLLTAYDTGERVSGLLGLRFCDVSQEGVIFRAETRKGSTRDIYRTISPDCRQAIELIRDRRAIVFEWDRCPTDLWRHLDRKSVV